MKAISTKFLGLTRTKGARYKAWDLDGNSIEIPRPDCVTAYGAHLKAAQALCDKMGWTGELRGGAVKGGYVFVFV